MRKNPGRDGRPLEAWREAELFRAAFPEDWEGMLRIASQSSGKAARKSSASSEASSGLPLRPGFFRMVPPSREMNRQAFNFHSTKTPKEPDPVRR